MKTKPLSEKESFVNYEFIDGMQHKVIWRREEHVKKAVEKLKEESKANETFLIISIKKFDKIFGRFE